MLMLLRVASFMLLCSCRRPNAAVGDFNHQTTSSWWHCQCLSWPSGPSPLGTAERCTGQQLAGQLCLPNPGQHSTNGYRYMCHVFTELQTSPKQPSITLYVTSSLSYRSVLDTPASTHMSFFTELQISSGHPNINSYVILHWAKNQLRTPQHQHICRTMIWNTFSFIFVNAVT